MNWVVCINDCRILNNNSSPYITSFFYFKKNERYICSTNDIDNCDEQINPTIDGVTVPIKFLSENFISLVDWRDSRIQDIL